MSLVEQQLAVLVAKLPPAAQAELVDFATFLVSKHGSEPRRLTALDILAQPLPDGVFHTADEVHAYLQAERDAWER